MAPAVLNMEDISLRRGDVTILDGIDWCVRAGEHWAVLGPNGCGKTSLMMVATGYLPASRGRVFLIEGHISEIVLPEVRRRIGVVSGALADVMLVHHPRATGREVVLSGRYASLGLYERPDRAALDRAASILAELGAEVLADVPFRIMSTGQRQICLIGRCRMADGDLVILDEPCAGLDIAARERVLNALTSACRNGSSPPHILVTHHPAEIVPGITHVLLMREGRVAACGPREEVLTAAHLSAAYGLPLHVEHRNGRVRVHPAD